MIKQLILYQIIFIFFNYNINSQARVISKCNNKNYHHYVSKDTTVNNNIIIKITNPNKVDEDSKGFNIINFIIGILGLLITLGLGLGGINFKKNKKLMKDFKRAKDELENYKISIKSELDVLVNNHKDSLEKYSSTYDELLSLFNILKENALLKKDEQYNSFYTFSILNKISDSQPKRVILSALRMVSNMRLKEAISYIDQILASAKIDEDTKSFANEVKRVLLK